MSYPAQPFKDKDFSLSFYKLMIRARALEEKLIKMSKTQDGFFWIGGPGEEAFSIALGLLVNKGQGLDHDFLHLHYRSNGTLMAMGAPMLDFIRQMKCSEKDPFSGGRNFVSHVCRKEWNVAPVTSTIETQFSIAPGTARAQWRLRQQGKDSGITIVLGGDAGTAEGDFATALIWSSRPGEELPLLMIVTNNQFGISTTYGTQHGEKNVADRAKAFGIMSSTADGNNPEKAWAALSNAMDYVRNSGRPFLLELSIARLNGHSSSSGANREEGFDCIDAFEKKLLKHSWITEDSIKKIRHEATQEANDAYDIARKEAYPDPKTLHEHTFANNKAGGLPGKDS
ncbi:MAG: thiamine pyrophosphate-dependent dehydrogenase E1 component subunit alpha [Proteobacteria bacterium]|nr:thiamine pyrophosphate-dependent dehydrogenase E1 component subunit alpha [Pseudomonadota bacterium]